jgi:hypothetical protein
VSAALALLGCRSGLDATFSAAGATSDVDRTPDESSPGDGDGPGREPDPPPVDRDARTDETARDAGRPVVIDDGLRDRCVTAEAFAPLAARELDEVCFELLAHNGNWEGDPLQVPAGGEMVSHLYYEIPWPEGAVATRYGLQLSGTTSAHRALVFEVAQGYHGLVEPLSTGAIISADARVLAGWSEGGCNVELPIDVGLELAGPKSGKTLLVQWHHVNSTSEVERNASRFQICTVPSGRRAHVASITVLGTESIGGQEGIPSRVESTVDGDCANDASEPVTVFSLWPHMHQLATNMRVDRIGADGALTSIMNRPYAFDRNAHYAAEPRVVVQPGEKLRTSCTYFNSTQGSVMYGISLFFETCYLFVFSYPARALDKRDNSTLIGASNTCWGD